MNESWKVCIECDAYEVSSCGNVRRAVTHPYRGFIPFKQLIQVYDKGRYRKVCMRKNGKQIFKMVHSLIASAFIGKRPDGYEINHKDGNKSNNSVENLEYVTKQQNREHAKRLNLYAFGERVNTAKLSPEQVREIRAKFPNLSQGKLSKIYGINQAHISRIIRREAWVSVS